MFSKQGQVEFYKRIPVSANSVWKKLFLHLVNCWNCSCLFQVIDEIVEEWSKKGEHERIPLTKYTSIYAMKSTIHALFGTVLKGQSTAEFDFWKETEEVRDILYYSEPSL